MTPMPKYLKDLDILQGEVIPPVSSLVTSRRLDLERKDSEFARTAAQLERIRIKEHAVSSELRSGPVSRKYPDEDLQRLASFAERITRDNARKQAEPDIVAKNIRRTSRLLADLPRATQKSKLFDTAWRSNSRRVDVSPRTVFGTDAWIRTGSSLRRQFVTKTLALPCVERMVRREVIFAKGKGGRGYRVPHRMSKFADIWC